MENVTGAEVLDALEAAGKSRSKARRTAAAEMTEIERLVRLGKELGLDISAMAQRAGISRQTVYTILSNPLPQEDPQ